MRPDDAAAYHHRGFVKFTLGQYKEAIIDYDKAIQLKPSEHKPHSNEGNIISFLLEDTKFDEAEVYNNRESQSPV